MISVVIPTFNRAGLVCEAAASAFGQENVGAEVEVLVVDDGSSDDTCKTLESRFGSAVRVIGRTHGGVGAARNTGILSARGEWLAFLDSDDLWRPGKLAAQEAFFAAHPEMGICQTEEIWVRDGRRVNPRKYHRKPEGHCFCALLERCLVSPSAVMIHRELLEESGLFDESLPACEDYDLWLRIGCRHPIGLVPEPLVVKRGGRPDQLSATIPTLDLYRIRALEKLLRSKILSPGQERAAFETLVEKCRIYGNGCEKHGKIEEAGAITSLPLELGAFLKP